MAVGEKPVYLTRAGKAQLEAELRELVTIRRREVAERIQAAKEFADAGDSAEFEEAKEAQAFLEAQIRILEQRIANAVLIEHEVDHEVVQIGSRVVVVTEDGEEERYEIVGSTEANPRQGRISNESPVGRALIGRRAGEQVQVAVPAGVITLTIKATE